jgi:DASH complex subunit SPC19
MTFPAYQKSFKQLEWVMQHLSSRWYHISNIILTKKILKHFELLPEPSIREAQQSLLNEITPSITHLLSVASNHIDRLSRREDSLRAKCQLQEGRLSDERRPVTASTQKGSISRPGSGSGAWAVSRDPASAAKAAELRKLVQRKERLKFAVDRLELQSRQKERELRKSMAAPQWVDWGSEIRSVLVPQDNRPTTSRDSFCCEVTEAMSLKRCLSRSAASIGFITHS